MLAWTTEYAGFVPPEMRLATALCRIVITDVQAPVDRDRSWRGPDSQLAELVEYWFDQVRTWAEICTGQDLDLEHRVHIAKTVGAGLTFVAPQHEGALGLRLATLHIQPVSLEDWRKVPGFFRTVWSRPWSFCFTAMPGQC